MQRAIALAKTAAAQNEFPVGAVVVDAGHIIGEGFNQKEQQSDPTAHAEMGALRQAAAVKSTWRLTGCTLITTLEPCPMCLGAILQARIDTVVYLAKDLRWGACGSIMDFSDHPELNHRCQLVYAPNPSVVAMMRAFFKDQGKR